MPTARRRSPPPCPVQFYPPTITSLLDNEFPQPRRDPSTVPASIRYHNQPPPPFGGDGIRYETLQQEIEALDREEEEHEIRNSEIKEFGYSWLIPLGRQNTHEEEDDDDLSQTSTSPRNGVNRGIGGGTLDTLPPPPGLEDIPIPVTTTTNRRPPPPSRGIAMEREQDEGPVVDLDAEIEDADQEDDSDQEEEEGDSARSRSEQGSVDESTRTRQFSEPL